MAKSQGTFTKLLMGDGADPEVFTELEGQVTGSYSISTNTIDISDKDSGGWGATGVGTRNMTLSVGGIVNWPATQVKALSDAMEAGTVFNIRFQESQASDTGAEAITVSVICTAFDFNGDNNEYARWSATLNNTAAPTRAAVA